MACCKRPRRLDCQARFLAITGAFVVAAAHHLTGLSMVMRATDHRGPSGAVAVPGGVAATDRRPSCLLQFLPSGQQRVRRAFSWCLRDAGTVIAMSRQYHAYVWLFALFGTAANVVLISIIGQFGVVRWLPVDLAWSLFWLLIAGLLFLVAFVRD